LTINPIAIVTLGLGGHFHSFDLIMTRCGDLSCIKNNPRQVNPATGFDLFHFDHAKGIDLRIRGMMFENAVKCMASTSPSAKKREPTKPTKTKAGNFRTTMRQYGFVRPSALL